MQMQDSPYVLADTDLVMMPENVDRQYVTKFRDLPDAGKPREKLIELGPKALTLPELLAVILTVGTKNENVMELSQRVLREYGNSALIDQSDANKLAVDLALPLGKASQIVACMEIGRRLYRRNESGLKTIRTAKDLYDHVQDMHGLPKEQLRGIYLDTHNRVIHDEVISIGTINSNIVHPREVFKPALEYAAAAVVLVHNHPSGVSTPSQSDIEITKQLVEAGKMIGINLLDHIIVCRDSYASIDIDY